MAELKHWYFTRHPTIIGPKQEWFLCADIYVRSKCVAYRQIPVTEITNMIPYGDGFQLSINSFDTFEEIQTASGISSRHRLEHAEQASRLKQLTVLNLDPCDLDSYISKSKSLKAKHLSALEKLQNKWTVWT